MFIRQYTKKYVILIYKGACIQHSHVLLCRKCPCGAQTSCRNGSLCRECLWGAQTTCRNGTLCRKCLCGAQTPCRNGSLCRKWAYSAQFCGVSPVTGPEPDPSPAPEPDPAPELRNIFTAQFTPSSAEETIPPA